jgi:hypothetical protein
MVACERICDTAAHHPKYFAVPSSGWEMFIQFGNTLIQDKILAAISPATLGERYRADGAGLPPPPAEGHGQGEVAVRERGAPVRD